MSPMQETKDHRGKCIFYGSLPQETGGLTPMRNSEELVPRKSSDVRAVFVTFLQKSR